MPPWYLWILLGVAISLVFIAPPVPGGSTVRPKAPPFDPAAPPPPPAKDD